MAEFLAHGALCPHLARYPGLFGLYDNGKRVGDKVDYSSGTLTWDVPSFEVEITDSLKPICELLPPIEIHSLDCDFDCYKEEEGMATTDSESISQIPVAEDWSLPPEGPIPPVASLRRIKAIKISRSARQVCSQSTPECNLGSKSVTVGACAREYDLERLDKLLQSIKKLVLEVKELCRSNHPKNFPTPLRQQLYALGDYSTACVDDILVPSSHNRFSSPVQIFPGVQYTGHPLRSHPPMGSKVAAAAIDVIRKRLPNIAKFNTKCESILDLLVLLTATRATKHLASILDPAVVKNIQSAPSIFSRSASVSSLILISKTSERSAAIGGLYETLEQFVEDLVDRMRLRRHQYTIIKKILEGCGYLSVVD